MLLCTLDVGLPHQQPCLLYIFVDVRWNHLIIQYETFFLSLLSLQNYHSSECQQSADSCYCFMTSSPGVSCEQRAIPVQALHWLKGRERWTNGSTAVDRLVLGTPRRCHIVQQSLGVIYREKLSNPVLQRRRETPNTTTHHFLIFSY